MTISDTIKTELARKTDPLLLIVMCFFVWFSMVLVITLPYILGTLENIGLAPPLDPIWIFLWGSAGNLIFLLLVWLVMNILHTGIYLIYRGNKIGE